MKLASMSLTEFNKVLASEAPAPGGGSAAALSGAVGAALTSMVASLTIGKKKYAEHEELAKSVQSEAMLLKDKFLDVIDRDTQEFNKMSAVFAMPKSTDEEKAARKEAMQQALKGCTKTPYEMMELSLAVLQLTEKLVGNSNTSAASDLGVSALSIKAAVQGAWLNILINISGINDSDFVENYRKNGEAILAKALPLADKIYETVLNSL